MRGADRNKPCPCGSGSKWKRCEPSHPDQTPSMTREMEARRDLELAVAIAAGRQRARLAVQLLAAAQVFP